MTFAIPRFASGERIQVNHPKASAPGLPPSIDWRDATVSHYDRFANLVIEYTDGRREAISPERARRAPC